MLQAAVGEGQQRSVQGALGVLQDGIVLVDVLHHLGVELVLLKHTREKRNVTITSTDTVREQTFICLQYACSSRVEASERAGD